MNRYVKIKGYKEWFLVVDEVGGVPSGLSEIMSERLFNKVVGGSHEIEKGNAPTMWDRIVMKAAEGLSYEEVLKKAPYDLLIRESGSYMFLMPDLEIVSDLSRKDFPRRKTDYAQVVVCENDAELTDYWRHFFQRRYPGKTLSVINHFRTRSDNEIKKYFEKAEYVVFTTTFTSMDWWELLVRNLQPHNKVEGISANKSGWKKALRVYPNVKDLNEA